LDRSWNIIFNSFLAIPIFRQLVGSCMIMKRQVFMLPTGKDKVPLCRLFCTGCHIIASLPP
jgi:hypothetical protein